MSEDLRRLTVSLRELASLGWLHGTLGQLRALLGMSWRDEVSAPASDGRLDTASLVIEPIWKQDLRRWGTLGALALAMVITLAIVTPENEIAVAPPPPPAAELSPVAPPALAAETAPEPVVKATKTKKAPRPARRAKRHKRTTR